MSVLKYFNIGTDVDGYLYWKMYNTELEAIDDGRNLIENEIVCELVSVAAEGYVE